MSSGSILQRLLLYAVMFAVAAAVIQSAVPSLVALIRAAIPLVVTIGAFAVVLRVVWHYTDRL